MSLAYDIALLFISQAFGLQNLVSSASLFSYDIQPQKARAVRRFEVVYVQKHPISQMGGSKNCYKGERFHTKTTSRATENHSIALVLEECELDVKLELPQFRYFDGGLLQSILFQN